MLRAEEFSRQMIRISTIFVAICMVLVSASLGLVLYSLTGLRATEAAIVALAALTFLILYNAVSMRMRDRSDVDGQISDLSQGIADLARQVTEFGRRLAAAEGKIVSPNSAGQDRVQSELQSALGEINELGGLVRQLAASVAAHDDKLASLPSAAVVPAAEPAHPARCSAALRVLSERARTDLCREVRISGFGGGTCPAVPNRTAWPRTWPTRRPGYR